ncbi:hypothetical protein [Oleiharenicola lentus]|uniref:hypothetical protein n=1 Tax=Oleiharenicola lentus TaxID=2508720 RepID=UPI003F67B246
MHPPTLSRFAKIAARLGCLLGLSVGAGLTLSAFPPAPYHTIYGTVRDEHGEKLNVAGSVVVFYRNNVEVLRQTITNTEERPDQNYQIRLRMDMDRAGTRSYSSIASTAGVTFSLAVIINDVTYHPLEVSGPIAPTVGQPGERVRINLTLGVDSDGDGLPDAWEMSQLYAAGKLPGPNGWDFSLLDRDGDFDGDGIANHAEYIAGTFATDPTDFLSLQITARFPQSLRFRFFGIAGKTYTLETSTDLQSWAEVPAHLSNPADPGIATADLEFPTDKFRDAEPPASFLTLKADSSNFINLYAPLGADVPRFFYRLKVR